MDIDRESEILEEQPEKKVYQFGNYPNYYGYRNAFNNFEMDERIKWLKDVVPFQGKRVLDIGCNSGFATLNIGKHLESSLVVGVDIDESLIVKATKSLKMDYSLQRPVLKENLEDYSDEEDFEHYFPMSCVIKYGSLPLTKPIVKAQKSEYPFNTKFITVDFLNDSHDLLKEPFDSINWDMISLSLTKWIHLNWGDRGIIELFKRVYNCLNPNGHFILEAQPFSSYQSKARITQLTKDIYRSIQFKPEQFKEYLLSNGFRLIKTIQVPEGSLQTKGFKRPIWVYQKI
ncbi:Bicoid-interacting 3 domain-containing protein [Rozella allomycis CSF55]|uniref:RNA methyltransferase n=1 Tax=Rozella allomycis (strain CSF55) TaxID=988480 RepID=A0A075B006_ROZAC|nr:Bicoid-interacting 3 domain-containing protein [Rozella allomycis CSF55]|eukprot:EPZ34104.1 Bicoid-interacting 3 domain-containing protein [Rozella allomycis CSF55]